MDKKTLIIKLKKLALDCSPGILRPGQDFNSHTGHTVINISDMKMQIK
jgi:hypothetical protein